MVFDVRKNSERKRFKAFEQRVSISLESLKADLQYDVGASVA